MTVKVRAVDAAGTLVLEEVVEHGQDPETLLRSRALEPAWVGSTRDADGLVLQFRVTPTPVPVPYQRVAAYAVVAAPVHGRECLLLTSYSEQTSRAGWWGLPGGGLEEGESPHDGVIREVAEETGQRIVNPRPLMVLSAHWTGVAPSGRLEDFHAVRLVHTASCPDPVPVTVTDVDGTTEDAAWVPIDELAGLPLLDWVRRVTTAQGW